MNSVVLGDCIAGMRSLAAGSVDLVFADPPFNIGYDYDVYNDRKGREEYLGWSRKWIDAVYRALKPDGTFWLAIGDEYAAELKIASQDAGFHMRSWVIWYYTFGVNCKQKFTRSHAHLFHFVKDPAKFTFLADEPENRIPSARQLVYNDTRSNPKGRLPDDTWILRPQDLVEGLTSGEDTWYIPRVAGTFKERAGFHGCQMPEQLLGRIIRICSRPDDLVLDPFSGSATTLAVAKKLGRRFLGFDLSPEYSKRGTDRLEAISVGDPLDGDPEPLMSAPKTDPALRPIKVGSKRRSVVPTVFADAEANATKRSVEIVRKALIAAFAASCDGYSADRVVADPEFSEKFAEQCRKRDLPGSLRDWNHALLAVRKAGDLKHIPTTRITEILNWEEFDKISFASEIALQQMLLPIDQGGIDAGSLDKVLCDPELAEEFDARARKFAPGSTSLDYRWAALKLRKAAKTARTRAKSLQRGRLSVASNFADLDSAKFPAASGLFIVESTKKKLYIGEALNLRARVEMSFGREFIKNWQSLASRGETVLSLRFCRTEGNIPHLLGYQSKLVTEFTPRYNFRELASK